MVREDGGGDKITVAPLLFDEEISVNDYHSSEMTNYNLNGPSRLIISTCFPRAGKCIFRSEATSSDFFLPVLP